MCWKTVLFSEKEDRGRALVFQHSLLEKGEDSTKYTLITIWEVFESSGVHGT
jgi:hypothetical protein